MNIDIDIQLGNTPKLLHALIQLDGVKRGMFVAANDLRGKLREYPHRDSPNYVRTGNLRNRWGPPQTSNSGMSVSIGNNADYAPYVQGEKQYGWFERVWGEHSVKHVANREAGRVSDIVMNEIRRSLP